MGGDCMYSSHSFLCLMVSNCHPLSYKDLYVELKLTKTRAALFSYLKSNSNKTKGTLFKEHERLILYLVFLMLNLLRNYELRLLTASVPYGGLV